MLAARGSAPSPLCCCCSGTSPSAGRRSGLLAHFNPVRSPRTGLILCSGFVLHQSADELAPSGGEEWWTQCPACLSLGDSSELNPEEEHEQLSLHQTCLHVCKEQLILTVNQGLGDFE
ncbi:hypothetical protein AOLI_G00170510 [Acnodon oligacanthus]